MNPSSVERARASLRGLAAGDSFGDMFFLREGQRALSEERLPEGTWFVTDDTIMATSIFDVLEAHGRIDQEVLVQAFVDRYFAGVDRGYGGGARRILTSIRDGKPWRDAAGEVFGGTGSMGNGGAMRSAPIGAYFAGDPERIVLEARASAEVTHAHPDGQCGAIAVALAAGWFTCGGDDPAELFELLSDLLPDTDTRAGIRRASRLSLEADVRLAIAALGNGTEVISYDTVPFTIWSALRNRDDFAQAMWTTVSAMGDRDTTCAIVGGMLGARTRVPDSMRDHVERYRTWLPPLNASA